eukprot:gene13255-19094_t
MSKRDLHDISNVHHNHSGPQPKRARNDASEFLRVVEEAGCSGFQTLDGTQPESIHVADVRGLRHAMESHLRDGALCTSFMNGFEELVMSDPELLHRALMPMEVSQDVPQSLGDSFIRVALSIEPIQPRLCSTLLESLVVYGMTTEEPGSCIPDGQLLVDKVLEVLNHCPEQIQRQLIGFLPEITAEGDHERVLQMLMELVKDHNQSFIAPVLEALSSMQMCRELQESSIDRMVDGVESVEVEDLPALIRFIVAGSENCSRATIKKVGCCTIFHLVAPVLGALSSMQMSRELKESSIDRMVGGVESVEVEDLPALIRFTVAGSENCSRATIKKVGCCNIFHLVTPVLGALSSMQMCCELQESSTDRMVGGVESVEVEDMPALIRFIVAGRENCSRATIKKVGCCTIFHLVTPVLGALSSMQMCCELQESSTDRMVGGVESVDVEDLPALIRFIVAGSENCSRATIKKVVEALRGQLHFVNPRDPRLEIPDYKQKDPVSSGSGGRGSDTPEVQTAKELCISLQLHEQAADAFMKEIQDAAKLRVVDLWALVALHPSRAKQVELLLRKKISEGVATISWLSDSIISHAAALTEMWASMLNILQRCSCGEGGGGRAVARSGGGKEGSATSLTTFLAKFYVLMFSVFNEQPFHRQELLHQLHSHLGSGQKKEVDVGLTTLTELATKHTAELAKYGSYLGNILDYLESFSDADLKRLATKHTAELAKYGSYLGYILDYLESFSDADLKQIFHIFSLLTCTAGGGGSVGGTGGSSSAGRMQGGRLEDEVFIVVDKVQGGRLEDEGFIVVDKHPHWAAGTNVWTAYFVSARVKPAPALGAWHQRVDSMFRQCEGQARCLSYMMDQLSDLLLDVGSQFPETALNPLRQRMEVLLENTFVADTTSLPLVSVPGMPITIGTLPWFNLDEKDPESDPDAGIIYINIWPLMASDSPIDRACLKWMSASLR